MQVLKLHPDSRCAAVTAVGAEVTRPRAALLALRYVVIGSISDLVLPPPTEPQRTDGLWRHTCFEAFVRAPDDEAYYEFNFAPSSQWAAYRFDSHRQGMAPVEELPTPRIELRPTGQGFDLYVTLELGLATDLPPDAPWRLGLSAVIEEVGGHTAYWALAHPPGRADFHHADCFAAELPAPGRP
jgi:hypothetical protein